MAKISRADKEANFQKYNQIILDIFFDKGWDSVTYDNIAKTAGVRKSTLQGYYESNKEFSHALKGRVFPVFIEPLDFSSEDALIDSWTNALLGTRFRYILNMLISNSTLNEPSELSQIGIYKLNTLVESHFPEQGKRIIGTLLGKSILSQFNI